jgi:hypothetical protein
LVSFASLTVACSNGSGVPSDAGGDAPYDASADVITDSAVADVTDAPAESGLTAYPPPPYGNNVGDVFPFLLWNGYTDNFADAVATTKSYGSYSMDNVRKSGKAYALIHTSDTVDVGSQHAATDLATDGNTLVTAGAVVVEVLVGKAGAAPAKADLDAWVNAYNIPVTSMIDPPSQPLASLNATGRRELAFIVDLSTMKIVKKYLGDLTGVNPSSVKVAEPDLHTLLGK